eukprot:351689-Chlamydomonas_euryale.AAC.4
MTALIDTQATMATSSASRKRHSHTSFDAFPRISLDITQPLSAAASHHAVCALTFISTPQRNGLASSSACRRPTPPHSNIPV